MDGDYGWGELAGVPRAVEENAGGEFGLLASYQKGTGEGEWTGC